MACLNFMENLEVISEENSKTLRDLLSEDKYIGLELVEETIYQGGTGVKYWM